MTTIHDRIAKQAEYLQGLLDEVTDAEADADDLRTRLKQVGHKLRLAVIDIDNITLAIEQAEPTLAEVAALNSDDMGG